MTGVVYYIRFRDAIKIGTTTQPEGRLAELPWEEVLGFEPGGLTTERLRHSQFNAHQICGEWFHDNSELRQHIAAINQSHQEWQRKRFVNASPFPWDRKVATRWMRQPA
ncbi:GIY-YIG nuclease family protein [Gordonia aichiensis]